MYKPRLAPVLKTIFHQGVISYTCSQSNPDGSILRNGSTGIITEPSELDWLKSIWYGTLMKIALRTGASVVQT